MTEPDHVYITFGQTHQHEIDGKTFDRDCVAKVRGGLQRAQRLFGWEYSLYHPTQPDLQFFSRGVVVI